MENFLKDAEYKTGGSEQMKQATLIAANVILRYKNLLSNKYVKRLDYVIASGGVNMNLYVEFKTDDALSLFVSVFSKVKDGKIAITASVPSQGPNYLEEMKRYSSLISSMTHMMHEIEFELAVASALLTKNYFNSNHVHFL